MANFQVFFMIALTVALTEAAKEICNQRPKGFRDLKECCNIPLPKFDALSTTCNGLNPMERGPGNMCVFECIFNSTNAMTGYELNLPQVRVLLQNLFPDNEKFVNAYYQGFSDCGPMIKTKIEEARNTTNESQDKRRPEKCPPYAFYYSMCANAKMIQYCPADVWQSIEKCENAKTYMENCDQEVLDQMAMKGRGRREGRGQRG